MQKDQLLSVLYSYNKFVSQNFSSCSDMPVIVVYNPPRLVSSLAVLQKPQDICFLFHESDDKHLMISDDHSSGDIFGNSPLKENCSAEIRNLVMLQEAVHMLGV
jgi:hypothetical protein